MVEVHPKVSRNRRKPTLLALAGLAIPSAVMLLSASHRSGSVAFSAGTLTLIVAFACAGSRRVPVWIPWLGPFAILAAMQIVSHREHAAAHGGDDNGDLTDAFSVIVFLCTTLAVGAAFLIRNQSPPLSQPPE